MREEMYLYIGNRWIRLLDPPEEDICSFLKRRVRYILMDIFRKAGIKPNTCSVNKVNIHANLHRILSFKLQGPYHLKDFYLQTDRIHIHILPKGKIRALFKLVRKPENEEVFCLIITARNE